MLGQQALGARLVDAVALDDEVLPAAPGRLRERSYRCRPVCSSFL